MTALAAYEAGLTGWSTCWSRAPGGARRPLPVHRWLAAAGAPDAALVETVLAELGEPDGAGRVLDVGCGPGRLTAALAGRGADATGIDVSTAAVEAARARGASVVHGDVFGPVPDAGSYRCALLADGNLGIGGDPAVLLARLAELLAPGGSVVADVARTGGVRRGEAWVEAAGPDGARVGGPVPWAWVGADAAGPLGARAGLHVHAVHQGRRGAVVVWRRAS